MIDVLSHLWEMFVAEDATLVEVNPLVKDADGTVVALDGKVSLDENAAFRHPDHAALVDNAAENPLEVRAKEKHLNYVKLDGEVGIIGNGAGLVMSTLDVVAYAGEAHGGVKPANFLDIGGGASAEVMANGLDIILTDPDVKAVFVNVFGGITACDAVANGIVKALEILGRRGQQAAGRAAGRQQRRGGPADPRRGGAPAGHPGRHHGRRRRQGRRTGATRPEIMSDTWRSSWTQNSRVIVQGMTGSEGTKHTARMLASGTNIVGGVNARKAGTTVDLRRRGRRMPVFGTVAEAMEQDRGERLGALRAAGVRQGRHHRGDRRRHRAGRGDHRGHPGARLRGSSGRTPWPPATRPGSSGRTARASSAPGKSQAGIIPANITGPGRSGWCPSPAR